MRKLAGSRLLTAIFFAIAFSVSVLSAGVSLAASQTPAAPKPAPATATKTPVKATSPQVPAKAPAQQSESKPAVPKMKPLEATIATTNYLPPEMYGQWSVTARLAETNIDGMFTPLIYEIWVLEQSAGRVTISNPGTGAMATISVDKVEGNTAAFHRMQYASPKNRISESPTVTVAGDILTGTTLNRMEFLKEDRVVKSFYAKYIIEAERIKPARTRFGGGDPPPDFEFEIEPVRHE